MQWSFRSWLLENIDALQLKNMEELAVKTHQSRDNIYRHLRLQTKPTFGAFLTYCWAFGCIDQVEELWEKVCEEYGR